MWLWNCSVSARDWSEIMLVASNLSWIFAEVVSFCGALVRKRELMLLTMLEVLQLMELKMLVMLQLLMCFWII